MKKIIAKIILTLTGIGPFCFHPLYGSSSIYNYKIDKDKIFLVFPEAWQKILQYPVGPFKLGELFFCLSIGLFTILIRGIITKWIFTKVEKIAQGQKSDLLGQLFVAIEPQVSTFILSLGTYLALTILPLGRTLDSIIEKIYEILILGVITLSFVKLNTVWCKSFQKKHQREDKAIYSFMPLIQRSINIFIIILALILLLDNMGYSISGILTTLGLGGAALAFAAKDTIANLYGSIALAVDRPFKVGDRIQASGTDGVVEAIGFRSTSIRTLEKTLVSIPNNILANILIDNITRRSLYRVRQTIGITYDTPSSMMCLIVDDFKTILKEDKNVSLDYILVNFVEFGNNALEILIIYYLKEPDFLKAMGLKETINLKFMQAVEDRGSSIAYPTQTIYLKRSSESLYGSDDAKH